MNLFLSTTIYGIELGLCYAIAALGMHIAYSILDFPDLTADGSFPLGGVVGTIALRVFGMHPVLSLAFGMLSGMAAGLCTGFLHVKFNVTKLLSGIIVMTALLSMTLALTKALTGTGFTVANFSYIANKVNGMFNTGNHVCGASVKIAVLLAAVLVVKFLLDGFFATKAGLVLKAVGCNESLITSLGLDIGKCKMFGLSLANGLVGLSGCLYAQLTANYDNSCGSGKVVLTLASVIMGLSLFSGIRFLKPTTCVIFGGVLYSLCLNYFTLIDSNGIYLKLLNAVGFVLILLFNNYFKKRIRSLGA